jgi:hypothetical protein
MPPNAPRVCSLPPAESNCRTPPERPSRVRSPNTRGLTNVSSIRVPRKIPPLLYLRRELCLACDLGSRQQTEQPCRTYSAARQPCRNSGHLTHNPCTSRVVRWPSTSPTQSVRSAAPPPLYNTERIISMLSHSDLFGRPPRLVAGLIASRIRHLRNVFNSHYAGPIATSSRSSPAAAHRTVHASCPKCPTPPTASAIAAMLHLAPIGRSLAPVEHDPRTSR